MLIILIIHHLCNKFSSAVKFILNEKTGTGEKHHGMKTNPIMLGLFTFTIIMCQLLVLESTILL